MRLRLVAILPLILALLAPFRLSAQLYLDTSASMYRRVEDLLLRLSLDEKLSLMQHRNPPIPRLSIPEYSWWNEALHGVARNGVATVYPMPIGMAASFDPSLVQKTFLDISREAAAKHAQALSEGRRDDYAGLTFFTPNINILRDPRWGRGMETFGEDPFLTSQMGLAVVQSLPFSCLKHLAVHSGPEASRHSFDARVSPYDLWNTYLPAFEYIVRRGNPAMVMCAYNRLNSQPCCTNKDLLVNILRSKWHYKGILVTDCWALNDCWERDSVTPRHLSHPSPASAAADAFASEVDLECGSGLPALRLAVDSGYISEDKIDEHLRRILPIRLQIMDMDAKEQPPHPPAFGSTLGALTSESLVLLRNNGILPLRASHIAIVGPNAADSAMALGNYNGVPDHVSTILDAFQRRFPIDANTQSAKPLPAPKNAKKSLFSRRKNKTSHTHRAPQQIFYDKGCNWADSKYSRPLSFWDNIALADVVIFVGGISPQLEGEALQVDVPGFSKGDRTAIELPKVQQDLIHEIKSRTSKPIVLVLCSGSAIALGKAASDVDAILEAWYGGEALGNAVYDALMGFTDLFGHLPVTFYRSTAQLPDFDDYSMQGRTYRYLDCRKPEGNSHSEPLYPFGFGLSYRPFALDSVAPGLNPLQVTGVVSCLNRPDAPPILAPTSRAVVQVYLTNLDDPNGALRSLVGFQSITLKPGESARFSIDVDPDWLRQFNHASQQLDSPKQGTHFRLSVGFSSASSDLKHYDFTY